jgi:predicted transcriptional regulator
MVEAKAEFIMPGSNDLTKQYKDKLSHSAIAVLKTLQDLEREQSSEPFQEGPELRDLRKWVSTFKGSLAIAVSRRLNNIVSRGGVEVITQPDILEIIRSVWQSSISRLSSNEMQVLDCWLRNPELTMSDLSKKAGLSYAKTRRAKEHLRETGILRTEGRLGLGALGLDRVLLILKDPTGIIDSPYFTRALFVDSSPRLVLLKGLIPSKRRGDFLHTVRTLRSACEGASAWRLSAGEPRLRQSYFDEKRRFFEFDAHHFRLLLRAGGRGLTLGAFPEDEIRFPDSFRPAEIRILEELVQDYDMTAQEITSKTRLSESTVFRRRSHLTSDGALVPRPIVWLPQLTDRVVGLFSAEAAGKIIDAWSHLPLTYVSQISNMENHSERRILFATALPAGAARVLIHTLYSEKSRVDDYSVHEVAAGYQNRFPISSLFDARQNNWIFDSTFFDIRSYSVARREASPAEIPLDLA